MWAGTCIWSSDAVITVGGRFGSLHEFTSALEARKPCGVLLGSGGTADLIPQLMEMLEPPEGDLVIYDTDPERLVARIIEIMDKKYEDIHDQLNNHDEHWFLRDDDKSGHKG
jgi:predicted Rossmann-fold nucleotide-binding protein